jgi:hypothetical protein
MNNQEENNKNIKKIKRPSPIVTNKQLLAFMINNKYKNK